MRIINTVTQMQRAARTWQRAGVKIGFVPTMGYLHAGHISLVKEARRLVGPKGVLVVSIYVNPTQFGPHEDLAKYPRDLERDKKLCRAAGVDVVFFPTNEQMYPAPYSTYVVEETLSQGMEGAARPTHFRGVTTIVAKLFNIVLPDFAVFGAKDFQQAAVVQRMAQDLNFPLRVIVAPTHRETDGLAMSSRNKYLSPEERTQATILSVVLKCASAEVNKQAVSAKKLKSLIARWIAERPLAKLDYVEFFDPETLQPAATVKPGCQMALAVFFGRTRLIDNATL